MKKFIGFKEKSLKMKPRNLPKKDEIEYNFDPRIIFLLLSIMKINIFNEKRIFLISY